MKRFVPRLQWGSASQSDDSGDWDGGYIRIEWGSWSVEWQFTRLAARWRS